jgi:hypothetical protein
MKLTNDTESTMDYTHSRILHALGEASALFMSQECPGTEIVMPDRELARIAEQAYEEIESNDGSVQILKAKLAEVTADPASIAATIQRLRKMYDERGEEIGRLMSERMPPPEANALRAKLAEAEALYETVLSEWSSETARLRAKLAEVEGEQGHCHLCIERPDEKRDAARYVALREDYSETQAGRDSFDRSADALRETRRR